MEAAPNGCVMYAQSKPSTVWSSKDSHYVLLAAAGWACWGGRVGTFRERKRRPRGRGCLDFGGLLCLAGCVPPAPSARGTPPAWCARLPPVGVLGALFIAVSAVARASFRFAALTSPHVPTPFLALLLSLALLRTSIPLVVSLLRSIAVYPFDLTSCTPWPSPPPLHRRRRRSQLIAAAAAYGAMADGATEPVPVEVARLTAELAATTARLTESEAKVAALEETVVQMKKTAATVVRALLHVWHERRRTWGGDNEPAGGIGSRGDARGQRGCRGRGAEASTPALLVCACCGCGLGRVLNCHMLFAWVSGLFLPVLSACPASLFFFSIAVVAHPLCSPGL